MHNAADLMDADTLTTVQRDLIAYGRHRGLSRDDAEDAAAETAVRALEQGERLEQHPDRRAWLFRVMRNLTVDVWRHQQAPAPLHEHIVDPSAGPEATAVLRVEVQMALQALDNIPANYADLIMWCDVEARAQAEVAAELGVSAVVLRQRLRRARVALRQEYGRLGGTLTGLAVLIPNLRRAGRLRDIATAGALTPALVAAVVCVCPLPWLIFGHERGAGRQVRVDDSTSTASSGPRVLRPLPGAEPVRSGSSGSPYPSPQPSPRLIEPKYLWPENWELKACLATNGDDVNMRDCAGDTKNMGSKRYLLVRNPAEGGCGDEAASRECDYEPGVGTDNGELDGACNNLPDQPVAYCRYGSPSPSPSRSPS